MIRSYVPTMALQLFLEDPRNGQAKLVSRYRYDCAPICKSRKNRTKKGFGTPSFLILLFYVFPCDCERPAVNLQGVTRIYQTKATNDVLKVSSLLSFISMTILTDLSWIRKLFKDINHYYLLRTCKHPLPLALFRLKRISKDFIKFRNIHS